MSLPIVYCMMCQNNLHEVIECVDLVKPYVDKVVVVDGGSSDDTIFWLRNLSQEDPDFHFFVHPWQNNFSAQRNNYLSHAREVIGTDNFYVLVSDPDEFFERGALDNLYNIQDEIERRGLNMATFRCRSVTLKYGRRVWENLDDYYKGLFLKWYPDLKYYGNPHEGIGMPGGQKILKTEFVYEHRKQENVIWKRGCFVPGTRLITNRGYIPVEEIVEGDSLLDVNGDLKRVSEVMSREVSEEIMEVRRYGAPPVRVTHEHPIWTSIAKGCGVDGKAVRYRPFTEHSHKSKGLDCCMDPYFYYKDFGWSFAFDLNQRHILHFPKLKKMSRGVIPPIIVRDGGNQYKEKTKIVSLNKEICRLIGYYLSEGSLDLSRGVIDFSFSRYERDTLIEDLQNIVSTELDRSLTLRSPQGNTQSVKFCNKMFVSWVENVFGHGASAKRIPLTFIAALNDDETVELLKGIFLGDGTKSDNTYTLTLTSPHVIMSCWLMLCGLGFRPGLSEIGLETLNNPNTSIEHKLPMYRVRIQKAETRLFEDNVLFRNEPHFRMKGRIKGRPSKTYEGSKSVSAWLAPDGSIQSCITNAKPVQYSGLVYNVEVEDTHTYCLPYMTVHNCRNLITGGGGPNMNNNNKLWVELKEIAKDVYGKDLEWHWFHDEMLKGNINPQVKEWLIKVRNERNYDGASEHVECYKYYFRILHPEEEPEDLRDEHIL